MRFEAFINHLEMKKEQAEKATAYYVQAVKLAEAIMDHFPGSMDDRGAPKQFSTPLTRTPNGYAITLVQQPERVGTAIWSYNLSVIYDDELHIYARIRSAESVITYSQEDGTQAPGELEEDQDVIQLLEIIQRNANRQNAVSRLS